MTAAQFQQYLRQPLLIAHLPAAEMEVLVQAHPYCALLRLLLLKKYQMENPSAFEERLGVESAYSLDRVRLHQFLHTSPTAAQEQVERLLAVSVVSENPPRISARELGLEKKTLIPTDLSFVLSLFRKEEAPVQLIMAKKKKQKNASPSDGDLGDDSAAKKRFRLPRIAVLEENKALNTIFPDEKAAKQTAKEQTEQPTEYVLEEDPELGFVQNVDDAFRFLQQTDLFLRSLSERMSQQETTESSPEDAAAQASIVDNENIASETLARLLLAQNQRAKAVKIYRRLLQQQPEKSAYFLQLIEEAKK